MKRKRINAVLKPIEALAHGMDYPVDSLLDIPSLHLTGRDMVVVEGCRGVLFYSETKLTLDMGDYGATLHGRDLLLRNLSRRELTIEGRISAVILDGKEKSGEETVE